MSAVLKPSEALRVAEAARTASLHRWLITCDRAAYEAAHGTLDGPPETHRWNVHPDDRRAEARADRDAA